MAVSVCTGVFEHGVPEVEELANDLLSSVVDGETVSETTASSVSKKHCYVSG